MPEIPEAYLNGGAHILAQAASAADLMVFKLELFFLVLIRVSFIVFLLPFISGPNVPTQIKAGLSFFLALAIFPTLETHQVLVQEGAGNLLWWTLRECIVGILVGFVGYFLFAFVEFGAEIINREIGLNAMPIIDPGSGEYTTELTQVIVMTFSVMFLAVGGHVYLYHAIQQSFIFIPLGGLHYDAQGMAVAATALVAESIMYGFRLAAPVFVCMLLMGIALGFMSRIMPQMNVWIISVPLKVFVGIGTLIASLPLMYQLFGLVFERCYQYLHAILKMNGS